MYRYVYPTIFAALFVLLLRPSNVPTAAQATQIGPSHTGLHDLSDFDSLVATFSRPGITTFEQRAIVRTLGQQPHNIAGIRFLVRMMEVDFRSDLGQLEWLSSLDAQAARELPAADALVELGAAAAPALVDDYIAFHGKQRFADWPHHMTNYAIDKNLKPVCHQVPTVRLCEIVLTLIRKDQLAAAAVEYLQSRTAELPAVHPTRSAAADLMDGLRSSYHVADWERVFPHLPFRP